LNANLLQGRWILAGMAALLAALAVTGAVTAVAAVLVFAGLAVLVAFAPIARAADWAVPAARPGGTEDGEALMSRLIEALPGPALVLDRRGVVRLGNGRL